MATGVETLNRWVPSVSINGSIDDSMASMASMALQVPINRTLRAGSSASGGYWGNIAWSGHDLPRSFVFAGGNQGQWELSGARRGLPPRHGKQAEMEVETEMAFSRMGSPHHDMPRYVRLIAITITICHSLPSHMIPHALCLMPDASCDTSTA